MQPAASAIGGLWTGYLSTIRDRVIGRDLMPDRAAAPTLYLIWCAKSFVPSKYMQSGTFKYLTYTDWKHLLLQKAAGFPGHGQLPYVENRAALDVLRTLRRRTSVISLADGPYGPAGTLKEGLVAVAVRSGVPITTVSVVAERSIRLRQRWDSYELPVPFSRVDVCATKIPTQGRRVSDVYEHALAELGPS
jgi:hypothetical protein